MTPEQKQRLEQIQERWSADKPLPALRVSAFQDIQFLLFLVKEQEALIYVGEHYHPDLTWKARCLEAHADLNQLRNGSSPVDAVATARRIVEAHVHETRAVGHTDCDACLDAATNATAAIITALSDTATRMRSACVEKVREVARYYDEQAVTEYDQSAVTAAVLRKLADSLGRVALNLDEKGLGNKTSAPDRIYIDADYDAMEYQGHGGFFTERPVTGEVIEYIRNDDAE